MSVVFDPHDPFGANLSSKGPSRSRVQCETDRQPYGAESHIHNTSPIRDEDQTAWSVVVLIRNTYSGPEPQSAVEEQYNRVPHTRHKNVDAKAVTHVRSNTIAP